MNLSPIICPLSITARKENVPCSHSFGKSLCMDQIDLDPLLELPLNWTHSNCMDQGKLRVLSEGRLNAGSETVNNNKQE